MILAAAFLFMSAANAQEVRPLPQINVNGEGKIKVIPDQVFVSLSVESKGNKADDVKKQNDAAIEKVLQAIKKNKIPKEDVVTRRVSLNPQYDYDRKKYNYVATQTVEILIKDLNLYGQLMEDVVDAGSNRINNVEFRSSKLADYQSEARKAAIRDARHKAEDYVSVLGQKAGKAINIADNTQVYNPPMYETMRMAKAEDAGAPRETLAVGEISIVANVNVSFLLE